MKRLLLITALLIPLSLNASHKDFDVYLCIGQSNMAGRGELLPEDTLAVDGVFILDENGDVRPATARANIHSTIRKRSTMQGYNMALPFAARMHARTGRPVLLVVNARGGTEIDKWLKTAACDTFSKKWGDELEWYGREVPQFYAEAVRRTRQALEYGELKGILWHQGEADASEAGRKVYVQKLQRLVSDLRKDLKARNVPFIFGEVFPGKNAAINPYLDLAAEKIKRSGLASSEGTESKPDRVHFTRDALIIMGERYADEMLRLYR